MDGNGCKIKNPYGYNWSISGLWDLEQKYNLCPSIKGQEQTDRLGIHKINYPEGNIKQQGSSVVCSCLRNYKCASYGEFRQQEDVINPISAIVDTVLDLANTDACEKQ